jgi:hypothetical protein
VGACRRVELVEFGLGRKPELQYVRPHAAHQVDQEGPAGIAGRVHLGPRLNPDILQPRLAQQLWYPTAETRIGAADGSVIPPPTRPLSPVCGAVLAESGESEVLGYGG